MEYNFRKATDDDKEAITAIFNNYVENSYAAYFENKLPVEFYFRLKQMASGLPFYVIEGAENDQKQVVGFGLVHKYHLAKAFDHTAEITYFIHPGHIVQGLGKQLLNNLEKNARAAGIKILLANVSSANKVSLDFHRKNGFRECGRFERIGKKFGKEFDMVWLQKDIE